MERSRPRGWIPAAACFLNGDDYSWRQWERMIGRIQSAASERGRSDGSQVFFGRYGITIIVMRSEGDSDARQVGESYGLRKLRELPVPNWVVLSEGRARRLSISILGQDAEYGLAATLLNLDTTTRDVEATEGEALESGPG
jgi:hypothetical protein